MKGKINTILVGAGSPSEDDVKKMFGWSAHKFGQVGNLPEGHLYKEEAPMFDVGMGDPYWDKVVTLAPLRGDLVDAKTGDLWSDRTGGITLLPDGALFRASRNDALLLDNDGRWDFNPSIEDFTAEVSFKRHALGGNQILLADGYNTGGLNTWNIGFEDVRAEAYFWYVLDGSTVNQGGNVSYTKEDRFEHIALVVHDSVFKFFINGTLRMEKTITSPHRRTALPLTIGNHNSFTVRGFDGYIRDVRVTRGVARYTENFTPPTEPFPNFGKNIPALPTEIGEFFQGGYYIGDIEDQGKHYKILVAPIEADVYGLKWKTIRSDTTGTDSLTNGWSNTWSMNSAEHPAALHCLNYRGGGHDDWYMPAKNELNLFWLNIAPNMTTIPDFKPGGSQALHASDWYWASTQNATTYAWIQKFDNGQSAHDYKNGTISRVRPVRRLPFNP